MKLMPLLQCIFDLVLLVISPSQTPKYVEAADRPH